MSYFEMLS